MSQIKDLLQQRLSVANSEIAVIRAELKRIEETKEKAKDRLVEINKEIEDVKSAIDAIPKRRQ